ERDPGWTRFRLVHLADVHPGPRTERAHLDPVTRVVRRPLDGWVRVRNAWSDVRDVESEDVPIPSNRLVPIRDEDCDRVDDAACQSHRRAFNAATISGPSDTT